ncbi:MAG: glycosyltransferase family 2 protein [Anaerolineae bacterium]|nr:glycosyltransferase family 2 protein [Anaerolineae bacterium]
MTDDLDLPLVSVIMPVRNEAVFIRQSLGAVLVQDYPTERLEILVLDGLSTDNTVALIEFITAGDPRVSLLSNPGVIQVRGLNQGIQAARGDVIVRVDGHVVIAPDYVRQCVHYLQITGADNVGGPQRFAGITPMGRTIAAAYRSPFGVPSHFTISQQAGYTDTVYLGAWPRAVFDRVGLFDESLAVNEDYEFNYRIRKARGRIYFTPDIRSDYYGRQTLGPLWRQFAQYGHWKFTVLVKHPASVRPRHLVAPVFVAALVVGALLAPLNRRIGQMRRGLLLIYGAANSIASVRAAREHGWGVLVRLPAVFATMHLAWGGGFWRAALRWIGDHLR